MNIRRIISVLIVLLVIVLTAMGVAFYLLRQASLDLDSTQKKQIDSYLLAYELRQSSDDLTNMVRSYIETENADFENHYADVLAIRNGDKVRPEAYHRIYWDFVSGGQEKPRPDSEEQKPLRTLMKEKGFSDKELGLLTEAENRSVQLARLEIRAFNMMKGKYEDDSGNFSRLDVPDKDSARQLVFGDEYYKEKANIMVPLDDFFAEMEKRTEGEVALAEQRLTSSLYAFVSLFFVALIVIASIVFLGRKDAQRDLAERLAAQKKAEDENEHLNDSVISILEAVNALSERDLTARAPVTEDIIGTVSDSINALSSETAKVLLGVTDIAGEVADVSGRVKQQADHVTQTAEEERQNVQGMVESLLDATQTMNQVAALAEQSNESAGEATQITNDALETVNQTVVGMESIRETISETEKRIKRLGERSQEISGIVNLINTISERTHVLALNASMQAAVAGEAGRGFAVVAEEVQRLAESSRNATQQIATLVNNIQIETNDTINTVNQTIGQVVEGSEQAQRAGEQMQLTQQITDQLVSQVRSITQASEQQKAMSVHLLEAVQRIGESTEKTEQQIGEQSKETDSLLQASTALVESVGVFKLPPRESLA